MLTINLLFAKFYAITNIFEVIIYVLIFQIGIWIQLENVIETYSYCVINVISISFVSFDVAVLETIKLDTVMW